MRSASAVLEHNPCSYSHPRDRAPTAFRKPLTTGSLLNKDHHHDLPVQSLRQPRARARARGRDVLSPILSSHADVLLIRTTGIPIIGSSAGGDVHRCSSHFFTVHFAACFLAHKLEVTLASLLITLVARNITEIWPNLQSTLEKRIQFSSLAVTHFVEAEYHSDIHSTISMRFGCFKHLVC